MSATFDTSCLMTTVRNTSGATRTFSFLPPHGRDLANNEEFSVYGDMFAAIQRANPIASKRHVDAYIDAIASDNKTLTVLRTPSPIFWDDVLGTPHLISLENLTLVVRDPCMESDLSSS